MTVDDGNDADHVRIQLVVHGIGIARQEHTPEQAAHEEVLFWRTRDMNKCVINGVEKSSAADGDRSRYQSNAASISCRASARTRNGSI